MKFKRLLSLLLVVFMLVTFVSCGDKATTEPTTDETEKITETTEVTTTQAPEPDPATVKPLLYRVTDSKGNVVWLFGSIHVGREDYYPLPRYVLNAFNDSDSLAVELDIVAFEKDMNAQMSAIAKLVYTDQSSIKENIPEDVYNDAVEILKEYDSYIPAMDYYYPALWSSTIDSLMIEELGGDIELGIDRHFIEKAYEKNKKIHEIESAEFQYGMLASFDNEIQTELLRASIEQYKEIEAAKEDMKEMLDIWASGDEKAFEEFLLSEDEGLTPEEKDLLDRYNKAMVVDRNINMADFAEKALKDGEEVFICVGSAHVVGEGAMADLLAKRGYKVELVTK